MNNPKKRRDLAVPKCKCGENCAPSNAPKQYSFSIPFTKIDVHIMNWNRTDFLDSCLHCLMENDQDKYNQMAAEVYEEGFHDGYNNAMES